MLADLRRRRNITSEPSNRQRLSSRRRSSLTPIRTTVRQKPEGNHLNVQAEEATWRNK
jgi:hypothetical protein